MANYDTKKIEKNRKKFILARSGDVCVLKKHISLKRFKFDEIQKVADKASFEKSLTKRKSSKITDKLSEKTFNKNHQVSDKKNNKSFKFNTKNDAKSNAKLNIYQMLILSEKKKKNACKSSLNFDVNHAEKPEKKVNVLFVIIASMLIGFTNGFFGGGGGMICVPLLEKSLNIDNKKSHATTIAIIVPLSLASSVIYLWKNSLEWFDLIFVSIGVFVGGALGAILLKKFSGKVVRIIFAIIMIVAGVRMVI